MVTVNSGSHTTPVSTVVTLLQTQDGLEPGVSDVATHAKVISMAICWTLLMAETSRQFLIWLLLCHGRKQLGQELQVQGLHLAALRCSKGSLLRSTMTA